MRRCILGPLRKMQKKWLISCNFQNAAWFVNMINYLYLVENECIIAELTPEKVKERREKQLSAYPLWAV